MVLRCEDEADAGFVETPASDLGSGVELHSEPLQHVGRAAAGRNRVVAGLGDGNAELGRDERRGGRQVHGAGSVSTGPAAVGVEIVRLRKRDRGGEERLDRPGHDVGRFSAGLDGRENRGHLDLGVFPGDEAGEGGRALLAGERAPGQGLEDVTRVHCRPTGSRFR